MMMMMMMMMLMIVLAWHQEFENVVHGEAYTEQTWPLLLLQARGDYGKSEVVTPLPPPPLR
jgi:hypothetical protein